MNDPAFLAQLEGVKLRAIRERSVITGLSWRGGRLRATLTKRRDLPKPDPEPVFSKRGAQGELL